MSTFTVQENNTFTNNYMPPTRNHLQKSSIHSWQGFRQDFVEGCPNLLEIYVTKSEFVFKTHGIKQCTWYHTWQLNSLLKKKRFFLVLISSLTFGILLILSIFFIGCQSEAFQPCMQYSQKSRRSKRYNQGSSRQRNHISLFGGVSQKPFNL